MSCGSSRAREDTAGFLNRAGFLKGCTPFSMHTAGFEKGGGTLGTISDMFRGSSDDLGTISGILLGSSDDCVQERTPPGIALGS